ncbi:MAG: arylsulfotransferase (ASST) [Chloroflexi bacterium]|nr:arylsulfotransferase (ASST) [Chloroflexota bacterium]
MKKRNVLLLSFLMLIAILTGACAGPGATSSVSEDEMPVAENPVSKPEIVEEVNPVVLNQNSGSTSYLFSPIRSTSTYLMDVTGNALHTWESAYTPGNAVYLLENGNLLRTGSMRPSKFDAGGSGGIIEEIAPDSTVIWSYQYANDQVQQHHDIEQMPNGNILIIAWEMKTKAEAVAAGRDPNLLSDGELWPDHVVELDPKNNTIVWEWHVWDHLVQDFDAAKENYGVVSEHPELIDINFTSRKAGADWNHINSIDYNAELDQILLSAHSFSEIWIIDHNTTTESAAGAAGDLLYRWGNPQTYDSGSSSEEQFYVQHDAQWIPSGFPGAGNILVFNNGDQRTRAYSSIDEIVPPLNADGSYSLSGASYAPTAPIWTYVAENPSDFFADHISGAQRLSNGNTLICSGTDGLFFEVTPAGEIVWQYDYGDSVFRITRYEADYAGLPDSTSFVQSSIESVKGETLATGAGQNAPQGGQRQPPQAAIDACSTLSQGDTCTFTAPRGNISGVCTVSQTDLACKPQSPPG